MFQAQSLKNFFHNASLTNICNFSTFKSDRFHTVHCLLYEYLLAVYTTLTLQWRRSHLSNIAQMHSPEVVAQRNLVPASIPLQFANGWG